MREYLHEIRSLDIQYTDRPGIDHPRAEVLHFQTTTTLNRVDCARRLGRYGAFIHPNTICTQNRVGQGICTGDQGGPLVDQNGLLVGIASWGIECGRGFPDVYVNVFDHL